MTWPVLVFTLGLAAGVGLFEVGVLPAHVALWKGRLLELLLPPLLLLRPRDRRRRNRHHPAAGKEHYVHNSETGQSRLGAVLAFSLVTLTIFRFATVRDLMHLERTAYVPVPVFNLPAGAEPLTFVFWYMAFAVLVGASFPYRPASTRKAAAKLLVPEVIALFLLAAADCILVVLCDYDENELGDPTLALDFFVNFEQSWHSWFHTVANDILDDLPRLWFMLNLSFLIAITIAGQISPPPGTMAGCIFDGLWSVLVSQCVAMMLQRTATRSKVVLELLKHAPCLAVCCGLSVLFCTHSLAMALAIVFRQHEHEHVVPSIVKVWRLVFHRRLAQRAAKVAAFLGALFAFNSVLKPGMMESPLELLLVAALHTGALVISASVLLASARKHCHAHSSWEATLICVVGPLGAFAWWAELCRPVSDDEHRLLAAALSHDQTCEEGGSLRMAVLMLSVVTHVALTALFADVFRRRLTPTPGQSLFFTFWASTTLLIGAKLEHHSAVYLARHQRGGLRVWEVLEHLGEFGICEFGLISTMAWVTYLAQYAGHWWGTGADVGKGLAEPLIHP